MSLIVFFEKIGLAGRLSELMPFAFTSPNAIPPATFFENPLLTFLEALGIPYIVVTKLAHQSSAKQDSNDPSRYERRFSSVARCWELEVARLCSILPKVGVVSISISHC